MLTDPNSAPSSEAEPQKHQVDPWKDLLDIRPAEAVSNAFPLLRVLQLGEALTRLDHEGTRLATFVDIRKVHDSLLERVHRRLSESHIPDGGFDAADLVFSLEGWILASPVEPDLAVVDEAFRVLSETQERTAYWRPLRPFKATQKGLVLLPQSVETAKPLLRICGMPGLEERDYFNQHSALLDRYTRWLRGRVFRGAVVGKDDCDFVGWESEHTYTLNRIHLWLTSQVLIFLQHYLAMRQQRPRELSCVLLPWSQIRLGRSGGRAYAWMIRSRNGPSSSRMIR